MTRGLAIVLVIFSILKGKLLAQHEDETPLLFQGLLVDDLGDPIPGAQVQFWQTGLFGLYKHPRSGGSDPTFQYYGTDTTDGKGEFSFKTYKPVQYLWRPPHIHFKVWIDGNEALTSQFYFSEDGNVQPDLLMLDLKEGTDAEGSTILKTSKTVVINLGGGGSAPLTPSQTEGPFYPVEPFFDADNDLTKVDA